MIPPPAYFPKGSSSEKKGYVYLLSSLKDGKYYLGWITDLRRRVEEHNSGQSLYTRSRGLWELIGYETYEGAEEAKQRERKLKHNPRMLSLFKKRMLNNSGPMGRRQVVG